MQWLLRTLAGECYRVQKITGSIGQIQYKTSDRITRYRAIDLNEAVVSISYYTLVENTHYEISWLFVAGYNHKWLWP